MTSLENNIIYSSLEILYNLNRTDDLLESVGLKIEGNIKDNSIGSNIYESMSHAYDIIEDIMKENFNASYEEVQDNIERIYIIDDDKNNIIKEVHESLINFKKGDENTNIMYDEEMICWWMKEFESKNMSKEDAIAEAKANLSCEKLWMKGSDTQDSINNHEQNIINLEEYIRRLQELEDEV